MSDYKVDDRPGVDDPIWDYVLEQRLRPYIPIAREWWDNVDTYEVINTGVTELKNGLYIRVTRAAARSPIKGIQAFPFIPTARLQIIGVQGGSSKMVERVCMDGKLKIEEFTIVCKSNLPSTFNSGQFVAFIPTAVYDNVNLLGRWIYITHDEAIQLASGFTPKTVIHKALTKL